MVLRARFSSRSLRIALVASIASVLVGLPGARRAGACLVVAPTEEMNVPVALSPTQKAELRVSYFEFEDEAGIEKSCSAWISVRVSAYPTVRLIARPSDFAGMVAVAAEKWKLSECVILVSLENDLGEDLSLAQTCIAGRFGFAEGGFWPMSSEDSCYAGLEL